MHKVCVRLPARMKVNTFGALCDGGGFSSLCQSGLQPYVLNMLFSCSLVLFADCVSPPVSHRQMGNNNSSRYGVVTQLQFDDGDIPKMVGSLNRTYLLEKSRVVSRSSRERNFHVFYQMVGSDDEEFKKSLQLSGLARLHFSWFKTLVYCTVA